MNPENQIKKLLVILLVILLLSMIILYGISKYRYSKFYFEYNDFKIHRIRDAIGGETYKIEIYFQNDPQPHYLNIRYNPKDLEDITIEGENIKEKLLKNEIFITMPADASSKSVLATMELSKITGNEFLFNIPTRGALTSEAKDNPVRTCKDADGFTSIVYLKPGKETKIYSEGECIIIEAIDEDESIKATTKLSLYILGIMK